MTTMAFCSPSLGGGGVAVPPHHAHHHHQQHQQQQQRKQSNPTTTTSPGATATTTTTTTARSNRCSVVDYDTEDELRRALMAVQFPTTTTQSKPPRKKSAAATTFSNNNNNNNTSGTIPSSEEEESESSESSSSSSSMLQSPSSPPHGAPLDWVLTTHSTNIQSMEDELHRLQVLKSYTLLDADREEAFERLTGLAARYYQTAICLISVVDLGRLWLVSSCGLPPAVREIPRQPHTLCAHTITLPPKELLVVPNAAHDPRFNESPMVTGPVHVRFYAGAPLVSPEGYKLGTFAIVDTQPRPAGLTAAEEESLRDFADLAVREMVKRRSRMNQKRHHNNNNKATASSSLGNQGPTTTTTTPSGHSSTIATTTTTTTATTTTTTTSARQLIAYTAHDLLTPLSGVQLSLSLLKDDEQVQARLFAAQKNSLVTAAQCSQFMIRLCQTAVESMRRRQGGDSAAAAAASSSLWDATTTTTTTALSSARPLVVWDWVRTVALLLEPVSKSIPVVVTVDPQVPPVVVGDDLPLVRSCLNLIVYALQQQQQQQQQLEQQTSSGGVVRLRVSVHDDKSFLVSCTAPSLVVHTTTTNDIQNMEENLATMLFSQSLGLRSVGTLVQSLDGDCGVSLLAQNNNQDDKTSFALWFSVPLFRPEQFGLEQDSTLSMILQSKPPPAQQQQQQQQSMTNSLLASSSSVLPLSAMSSSSSSTATLVVPPASSSSLMEEEEEDDAYVPMTSGNVMLGSVPPLRRRGRRALVIEDTHSVRKTLARAIDHLGLESVQAVHGLDGLEHMQSGLFDFVLCDFLMPVLDGLDCVKQYRQWERQHRPHFRMVIIGISAHADETHVQKGLAEGMDDFQPKPISRKLIAEIYQSAPVQEASQLIDEIVLMDTVQEEEEEEDVMMMMASSVVDADPSTTTTLPLAPIPGTLARLQKRARPDARGITNNLDAMDDDCKPPSSSVCLLATTDTACPRWVSTLEQNGFKVVLVNDGDQALNLLKFRQWDAVVMDLPNGVPCMQKFRAWEVQNRVQQQQHTYLAVSSDDSPIPSVHDARAIVQPPTGFDGVLGKPVQWEELNHWLQL